jgi:hypothetical protein
MGGRPETLRSIKSYRTDLILFGERSMQRLVYGEDPFRDGKLEDIPGVRGAASRLCSIDIGDFLIHAYAGGKPEHLSESIDPYFDPGDQSQGYVDFQYRDQFHAVHYPNRHQVLWFVVMNGIPGDSNTYVKPQHAIAYDYQNGSISIWRFDVAMVASTMGPGADGTSQTLLADENGNLWVVGIGTTDGVHTASPVEVNAAAGATATNIPLSNSAALYADADGLQGATAYWPDGDVLGVIASNSASGFILAGTGFGSAPDEGDTIYLGRIPARLKSKAFVARTPDHIWVEPRYLNLFFEPQAVGRIRVRWYINRSSAPYTGYVQNFEDDGVSLTASDGYYVVDITQAHGHAKIPTPASEGASIYTLEFEIEIVSAAPFELNGYTLDGYAEEEDLQS